MYIRMYVHTYMHIGGYLNYQDTNVYTVCIAMYGKIYIPLHGVAIKTGELQPPSPPSPPMPGHMATYNFTVLGYS